MGKHSRLFLPLPAPSFEILLDSSCALQALPLTPCRLDATDLPDEDVPRLAGVPDFNLMFAEEPRPAPPSQSFSEPLSPA